MGAWEKTSVLRSLRQQRNERLSVLGLLACIVVIATAAALMLPVISMTQGTLTCGMEEHSHSEACYEQVLTCGIEEGPDHQHDASCYAEELICDIPEHEHSDACYTHEEEPQQPEPDLEPAAPNEPSQEDVTTVDPQAVVDDGTGDSQAQTEPGYGGESSSSVEAGQEDPTLVDPYDSSSAAALEELPEDEQSADESMPAQSFYETLNAIDQNGNEYVDVAVSVEAGKGAFPEGTTMWLEWLPEDYVLPQVEQAVKYDRGEEAEVESIYSMNIVFMDAQGSQIEPAKSVDVKIFANAIYRAHDPMLVHVTDRSMPAQAYKANDAEVLGKARLVHWDANDKSAGNEDSMKLKTSEFGSFAIVDLKETENLDQAVSESTSEGSETDESSTDDDKSDTEEKPVIVTTPNRPAQEFSEQLLDASGQVSLIVNVDAPEGSLPEGSSMKISPVTTESVLDAAKEKAAAETSIDSNRAEAVAVDITFYDEAGKPIEPAADVHVTMSIPRDIATESLAVVHMPEDKAAEVVATTATDPENATAEFDSAAFSVYAMVYTVDFTWVVDGQSYEFSFAGGSVASFRELVEALHLADGAKEDAGETDGFISGIADITFSDESLMCVVPVTEGITAGGLKQKYNLETEFSDGISDARKAALDNQVFHEPDWALVSLRPFESVETLTVTMVDGEQFTIAVTDAQIEQSVLTANGETYNITVTYGGDAGIPDGAKLNVREIEAGSNEYGKYVESSAEQLGFADPADVTFARFFDIEISDKDGNKVEPTAAVDVDIKLTDAPDATAEPLKVVHFESETPEVLEAETASTDTMKFVAESFSVYGVITADPPSGVNDLDGRTFTISKGSNYITSDIVGSNPTRFGKSNIPSNAAVWQFEATGANGRYSIFTYVDGVKKYMQISGSNGGDGSNASLGDSPQAFTVIDNNNGTYTLQTTANNRTYYLNEWEGSNGTGFAGYANRNPNDDSLTFNWTQPAFNNNGGQYMTLVKYADKYYIVNNDATLTEVEYDEATKSVAVDDPMLWTFEGNNPNGHIYFNSVETGFNSGQTASDWYRRYLDPSQANAFFDENSGNVTLTTDYVWYSEDLGENVACTSVTDRTNVENQTTVNIYDDPDDGQDTYRIYHGNWNAGGNYLGLAFDEDGNPTKLVGQKDLDECAQFVFASATHVNSGEHLNNAVNHIDISIAGTAGVSIPLAYGNYYGPQGDKADPIKVVVSNTKLELSTDQMVDQTKLRITTDDIKGATITACRADTGEPIDDAFVITGYSGNVTTPYSGDQVRIEGSFLCSDLRRTEYETINGSKYDGFWGQGIDWDYVRDVRQARLDNKVEYTVTVVKPLEYYLIDPVVGQLYDEDGNPITVTVDVAFSASFNYWDNEYSSNGGNECPPLQGNTDWQNGDIPSHNASGMDFVLGGDANNPDSPLVAIEITKVIMDEQGNRIELRTPITTYFDIYENKSTTVDKNGVSGLHVGEFGETDPRDATIYDGYDPWRTKRLKVDETGSAIVFDFNATDAMYYIEERHGENDLPETIIDRHGEEWTYEKTYIETEYVRRGDQYDDKVQYPAPMHVSPTYTRDDEHYKSIPEVAGHFLTIDSKAKKEGFLEFYVYNIYTNGTKLDVEKQWDTPEGFAGVPDGAEATVALQFRMRQVGTMVNGAEQWFENESQYGEWWPATDLPEGSSIAPVKDGDNTEWALVKDNQGSSKIFDAKVKTTLTLTASPETNHNWRGSFNGLPETYVDADGKVYELDYCAKETSVKVPGPGKTKVDATARDVTSEYQVTTNKEDANGSEAEFSDGTVTITNKKGNLTFKKKWLRPDGTEFTPASTSAVVSAELRRYKNETTSTEVQDQVVTVTLRSKAASDANYTDLRTVTMKSGSSLSFSLACNRTSNPQYSTSPEYELVKTEGQSITYNNGKTKPSANLMTVNNVTDNLVISAVFQDDQPQGEGFWWFVDEQSYQTPSTHVETETVPVDELVHNIVLNQELGWTYTLEPNQMENGWTYYIKPDTISETGINENQYEWNSGPIITYDNNGNATYACTNTSKGVSLDVEKVWDPALDAGSDFNAQVTVELQYRLRPADGSSDDWSQPALVKDNQGDDKPFDQHIATQLLLDATNDWSGGYEYLPTIVTVDGVQYEVDYSVAETQVMVNGKNLIDQYVPVTVKTKPTASEAATSNGSVTVTNTKKKTSITAQKAWDPLPPASANASVTVELHRYAKLTKGTIGVHLTDDKGAAIAGAEYELYQQNGGQFEPTGRVVSTDVNGKASISGLDAGTYKLVQVSTPTAYDMEAAGCVTETEALTVADDSTEQQSLISENNNVCKVTAGSVTLTVTGPAKVYDPINGWGMKLDEPVRNATVSLYKDGEPYEGAQGLTTNDNGQVVVNLLPAGQYYFMLDAVTDDNVMPTHEADRKSAGFTIVENPGVDQPKVDHIDGVYASSRGTVTVVLTKLDDNAPIDGAEFTLTGTADDGTAVDLSGTTVNGEVTFGSATDKLHPGTYTLHQISTSDGMKTAIDRTVTIEDDSCNNQNVEVSVTNAYEGRGVFELTLTSNRDEALSGAEFELTGNGVTLTATTDENGRAVFGSASNKLAAGSYTLTQLTKLEGLKKAQTQTVVMPDNGDPDQTIACSAIDMYEGKGTVVVTLTKENNGGPISGASFELHLAGSDTPITGATDSNGQVTFINVPEGTHTVEQKTVGNAGDDYSIAASQQVTIEEGDPNQVKNLAFVNDQVAGNVTLRIWRGDMSQYNQNNFQTVEHLKPGVDYIIRFTIEPNRVNNGDNIYYCPNFIPNIAQTERIQLSANQWVQSGNLYYHDVTFNAAQNDTVYNIGLISQWGLKDDASVTATIQNPGGTNSSSNAPMSLMASHGQDASVVDVAPFAAEIAKNDEAVESLQTKAATRSAIKAVNSAGTTMKAGGATMPLRAGETTVTDAAVPAPPEGYAEDSTFEVQTAPISGGNWNAVFGDLDQFDVNGDPYVYYIKETDRTPADYWVESYSEPDANGVITVTNKLRGQISIQKAFAGNAAGAITDAQKQALSFTVTGPGGYNEPFSYGVDDADRNATWSDGTLTITGLLPGTYTVTESGDQFVDGENTPYIHSSDIKVNGTGATGIAATLSGTNQMVITNTYDTAQLVVNKTVTELPDAGTTATFTFTITGAGLGDGKVVTLTYPDDFTDGNAQVVLTHKDGIQLGETYTVTESVNGANVTGYTRTTTVDSTEFTQASGTAPTGSTATNAVSGEGSIDITNAYTQDTTSVSVYKQWAFADGTNGWPEGVVVTVQLYSKVGSATEATPVSGKTLTLDSENTSGSFDGLPLYSGGESIEYSVVETGVTGVDQTHFNVSVSGSATTGYTITNSQKTAGLTIIKTFTGGASLTDAEKNQLTFTVTGEGLLDGDGNNVASLTKTYAEFTNGQWVLNESDGIVPDGTYIITETNANIDKYTRSSTVRIDGGEPVVFAQDNDDATAAGNTPGGNITLNGDSGTVAIDNTYEKEQTSISGAKTWIDLREHSNANELTLVIKRTTAADSADSDWETLQGVTPTWEGNTYTFTGLDKYDNDGNEYTYKVEESAVAVTDQGNAVSYSQATDGNNFTNTELVKIEATKTWNDVAGNSLNATMKNASVTFTLQQKVDGQWQDVPQVEGQMVNPVTMSVGDVANANAWKATWENLPKYVVVEGVVAPIEYQVVETAASVMCDEQGNGTSILDAESDNPTQPVENGSANIDNILPETSITVTKQWKDGTAENEDKVFTEAKTIAFTLYQKYGEHHDVYRNYGVNHDGKGTVTYTPGDSGAAGSWSVVSISDLPKYVYDAETGTWHEATYYVVEENPSGVNVTYLTTVGESTSQPVSEGIDAAVSEGAITIVNTDEQVDVKILKVDADHMTAPLEGAKFELYRINENNSETIQRMSNTPVLAATCGVDNKTGADGMATFAGLATGYYEIAETEVPNGYNFPDPSSFYIKIDSGVVTRLQTQAGVAPSGWQAAENTAIFEFNPSTNTAKVGNKPGKALPHTGGIGTEPVTVLGALLVVIAGLYLLIKRRPFLHAALPVRQRGKGGGLR